MSTTLPKSALTRSTRPLSPPPNARLTSRPTPLTDPVVLDALNEAERRGVAVRIVLDPRERHDFVKLGDLSDNVRIKRGGPFMHLKAYEIDGEELRTGSANFSTSGENAQDNDLIVIRDPRAAAKFDVHFERMWHAAQPMDEFEPAINALEPK
jgi:phosphatidylserine/phosphatidylglycerophosphate/cardiolipin synthase-like enzyme